MRIPLDWLKEYIDLDGLSSKEISEAFTLVGLMEDKPFDGKVFDLEHRFDRSDWLSILGCARDLAAFLNRDLKLPKTHTEKGREPTKNQLVKIEVECSDVINRFNTRVFRNLKVKASPEWLKTRLEQYGIPSINNVVDITNYVMVELGQPMHAQDLSKFRKQEIVIRKARNEEKIVTFLGEELILYSDSFVLTQDGVATVLGGIVGGKETGVDTNTADIILDAGNYDQNIIRKTSRRLKIQNETVLRYDKFLHPSLTQYAIERATYLILELAGGEYYQNVDWSPGEHGAKEMTLRIDRLEKISGFKVDFSVCLKILKRLGYHVIINYDVYVDEISDNRSKAESIKLIVPYFRTDIEVEDDIISDILRIYGYSKIPSAQIQSALPNNITPEIYTFEDTLRDLAVTMGGHEHITDPLVLGNRTISENQVFLENSQNSQKNALRSNLFETLNEIVPNYTRNHVMAGLLFEIGRIYHQNGNKSDYEAYKERRVFELMVFDIGKSPKELHKKTSSLLSALIKGLGINKVSIDKVSSVEARIRHQEKVIGAVRYNGFTLYSEELLTTPRRVTRLLTDVQKRTEIETSILLPKNASLGIVTDALHKLEVVTKAEVLEEYSGKELGENMRSVLIKTYFDSNIDTKSAQEVIDRTVSDLKQTLTVSVRK